MGASLSASIDQGHSGTSFEILEESLANAKVDVIVNSCNQALLLAHGGMSRALVRAAGPGLQAECSEKYPNGVDFGEIAVTKGHRLACKSVYHIALPQWGSEFVDPLKVLQSSVSACLANADFHGMKSIAFPALGCGFLNYPHDVVAKTMQDCLRQFKSSRRSSSIRKVVVCVWPQGSDWKHVKEAFIRESKKEDLTLPQTSDYKEPEMHGKQNQNPKQDFLSTCIRETSHNACKKVLSCGHVCCGYRGEPVCPPCMQAECGGSGKQNQTAQDDCIICYSDHLGAAPVAKLRCGHIFHLHCVKRILQNRWVGQKINFNFTKCPVCKKAIDHPDLQSLMDPIRSLEEDITQKALMRLDYDGLKDCREITQRSSKYYRKPELFAMDRYIYYMCFKCHKAFYGGTEREGCAAQDDASFDTKDLICPKCRGKDQQATNTDADVAIAVHSRQNAEADKVIESTTKACPHCKVRTEKNGGCMHMTCVKCRMDWCWLCEKQWCRECQSKHWFGENNYDDEEGRRLFRPRPTRLLEHSPSPPPLNNSVDEDGRRLFRPRRLLEHSPSPPPLNNSVDEDGRRLFRPRRLLERSPSPTPLNNSVDEDGRSLFRPVRLLERRPSPPPLNNSDDEDGRHLFTNRTCRRLPQRRPTGRPLLRRGRQRERRPTPAHGEEFSPNRV